MTYRFLPAKPRSTTRAIARRLTVIAAAVMVTACATQPGQEAEQGLTQQIAAAERAGTLESLFEKLAGEAGKKGLFGDNKEAQAALKEVGHRLALQKSTQARGKLNQARLAGGLLPLHVLAEQDALLNRMQPWDAGVQQDLARELAAERAKTQAALEKAQSALTALSDKDLPARYRLLGERMAMTGADTVAGREIARSREQALQDAYDAGVRDLEAQRLDDAQARFGGLAEIAPNFRDVQQKVALTLARQFAAVAASQHDAAGVDRAMKMYADLAKRADFAALKPELMPAASSLHALIEAKGGVATSEDKLSEAYAWLMRAKQLRALMGAIEVTSGEAKRFAEQAFVLAQTALKGNQPGLALGYLFAVEDIHPEFPALKRVMRETQEQTHDRAIKRITAANFTGSGDSARLGGSVASKLTKKLFQALPDDIRVVERDQLQAVMREQEIVAMQGTSTVSLSSADYLVQGAILEATVENSETKGRKTMRVVTRFNRVVTPEYSEWLKGSRNTEAPAQYKEEPVQEDIPINVSLVRKIGVFGVSYRIIDATSARMLFADTFTTKKTVSGENSEGLALGSFNLPMKLAELPSDSEILESLADEIANHIGQQMEDFLRNPEVKYTSNAQRYRNEDNYTAAADMFAKAWVLSQKKNKPTAQLGQELREMALLARPAQ